MPDGRLDLAAAGPQEITVLLRNAGNNGFEAGTYPFPDVPVWLSTGDMDGDGRLDLVSLSESGVVRVFRGLP